MKRPFGPELASRLATLQKAFLKKEAESYVALNIASFGIKGLVVKSGEIASSFLEKNQDLSTCLKKLLDEKTIPFKKIKLSVKNPSCLVRYFSFPKMDRKRMRQTLFYEINKFIPFAADEVYFDFAVIKETQGAEVTVLLAVAKKNYIDGILEAFTKANLKIAEINLDSICLINLFLANYAEAHVSNSCLLDMGYQFSTITILHKGVPFLTRDVKFSTKDIVQVISRIKGVGSLEAEERLSAQKDTEVLEVAQDALSNLCKEMKSSFDYFEVNKGEHIDKLYVSGGLAGLAEIEKPFIETLDIPTETLRVIPASRSADAGCKEKELGGRSNMFAAAFGLTV